MLRWQVLIVLVLLVSSGAVWGATNVAGNIGEDADWTIYGSPYRLTSNVIIPAGVTVTVRAGVEVIAQGAYALTVQGKLRAFGTQYRPVVFKSTTPTTPGSWGGIYVADGGVGWFAYTSFWAGTSCVTLNKGWAKFQRCWFLYAAQDGVLVYNESALHVQSSTFAYNQRRGLYVETPKPTGSVEDCVFMRNGEYPAYLKANCVDMLGAGLRFHSNGIPSIGVSCSTYDDITGAKIWHGQPIPLDLTAGSSDTLLIPTGASLTLQPGCRLLADRIQVYGTLISGVSGEVPVVIRGPEEAPGCWPGISLFPHSSGQFTNTIVRLAETAFTVDDASLAFNEGVVRDCEYDGIYATGGSNLQVADSGFYCNGRNALRLSSVDLIGTVDGCQFSASGDYPIFAVADRVAMLGANNKYLSNGRSAIGVACNLQTDLSSSQTWQPQGIPYDLTARPAGTVLRVGETVTWTLRPGVVIAGGGVDVAGTVRALGTATDPVLFTAAAGGSWQGLKFYPSASGTLSHCIVQYADTGVHLQSASPRIQHCTLRYCHDYAIYISGTSRPVIYNSDIVHNEGDGVRIVDEGKPNLGDLSSATGEDDGHNVLDHNYGYDIHNTSSHYIRAQNNWWATDNVDEIAQRIYDGNDTAGYGEVFVRPLISPRDNWAPVLAWADLPGTFGDGVSPDVAAPFAYVDFRVTYSDADGEAPEYVYLHLLKGESEVDDSPYRMGQLRGTPTDYQAGVIYHRGLRLPAGSDYSYYFEASDGLQLASGPPTTQHSGPTISATQSSAAGLIGSVITHQAPAGNIEIRCQMMSASHIDVEVLNIAGRQVARVAADRPVEAGSNRLLWNGRSTRGTKVPPGRYLVRITAMSEPGPQQQMMVPLWLGR